MNATKVSQKLWPNSRNFFAKASKTGMSNTNCCAGRIISLKPQMKKYPMFLSVLKAFFMLI